MNFELTLQNFQQYPTVHTVELLCKINVQRAHNLIHEAWRAQLSRLDVQNHSLFAIQMIQVAMLEITQLRAHDFKQFVPDDIL